MRSIAILGGKGGVKKTALARAIAVRLERHHKRSVIGFDMDEEQASFRRWMARRKAGGFTPVFSVIGDLTPMSLAKSIKGSGKDFAVVDGAAYASKITFEIAKIVDLTVLPTSYTVDDMESVIRVAKQLIAKGIPSEKILLVFSGVLESSASHRDAIAFVRSQGLNVIDGYIPLAKGYIQAQDRGQAICEVRYPGLFTLARTVIDGIIEHAEKLKL